MTFQSADAALGEKRADDSGEHSDDELYDGLPLLYVFEKMYHCFKYGLVGG